MIMRHGKIEEDGGGTILYLEMDNVSIDTLLSVPVPIAWNAQVDDCCIVFVAPVDFLVLKKIHSGTYQGVRLDTRSLP
jgi:hypothetical protein